MQIKEARKLITANNSIKRHMILSMGAGVIPVPFVDIIALAAVQMDMIKSLSKIYNIPFNETEGKAIMSTLTGTSLVKFSSRALKFIPGFGSFLGGITMSVMSGATTYALGEVFKKHFEAGGTFLEFDFDLVKSYYNKKFEEGKEIVKKDYQKSEFKEVPNHSSKNKSNIDSIETTKVEQLEKISILLAQKLITKTEFNTLKKEIFAT